MKFLATSVLALAATAFAAPAAEPATELETRAEKQTGPFFLKIRGKAENPTIDGYLASYHAGAAINALGYVPGPLPPKGQRSSFQYYFNATNYDVEGSKAGNLIWKLPANGGDLIVDLTHYLSCGPGGNVCSVMSDPSHGDYAEMGFNKQGQLFEAVGQDDSKNKPNQAPQPTTRAEDDNWVLCWQYVGGGYYYHSLGYALSFPTTNPTCRPVTVTKVQA